MSKYVTANHENTLEKSPEYQVNSAAHGKTSETAKLVQSRSEAKQSCCEHDCHHDRPPDDEKCCFHRCRPTWTLEQRRKLYNEGEMSHPSSKSIALTSRGRNGR